jgi:1,4-dihydroxy-2-naphthoyl-CoA synthase
MPGQALAARGNATPAREYCGDACYEKGGVFTTHAQRKQTSIECELRGRVQIIRMRRPDHGNRVSQKMAEEMIAALERARQSPDVPAY